MPDDEIDYHGHKVDELSQILLQILGDQGEVKAGDLADHAGIDDTTRIHQRRRDHLGPTAAGLMEQTGTEPRSGRQHDHVVYGLTPEGKDFVDAHQSELIDVVSAAEAVETLSRLRARIEEFEERVNETERYVEASDRHHNRWSTRVYRVEKAISELDRIVTEQAEDSRHKAPGQNWGAASGPDHETLAHRLRDMESTLSDAVGRLDDVETRLDEMDEDLDDRVTDQELENELNPLETRLRTDFESEIEENLGGLFS